MQFDADTVGSASPAADAEICMMAADTMERLGIARGSYLVKVNNRKVLDGVLETIGLGGDESAGKRLIVLRAIDKLDRLGVEGARLLLGKGRRDESGDFTKGAELSDAAAETVIKTCSANFDLNTPPDNKASIEGIAELRAIDELVKAAGYGPDRIRFDPSVVRGLEYYTGPVYEVELLIETKDEKGRPVRFGSVGGGGRYDGLVSRFRGEHAPATGFSIGVSRLQAALTLIGKLDSKPECGPVLVTVFDKDRITNYQKMVTTLRNAGIRAELYLGNPKHVVGQQLKYADKRNSLCAVIQGGDELNDSAGPQVIVKDLMLGAELTKRDSDDRAEHLQRQAEAQQKIPQSKLVEAVHAVLARHGMK
jgi:histidyl-tRNA synthetase